MAECHINLKPRFELPKNQCDMPHIVTSQKLTINSKTSWHVPFLEQISDPWLILESERNKLEPYHNNNEIAKLLRGSSSILEQTIISFTPNIITRSCKQKFTHNTTNRAFGCHRLEPCHDILQNRRYSIHSSKISNTTPNLGRVITLKEKVFM